MYAAHDPFVDSDVPDPQVATPDPSLCYSPVTFQPDSMVSSQCNPLRRPAPAWSDDSDPSARCRADPLADPCGDDDDEDDPTDPATRLLGKDFTQLLKSVALVVGRKKNPAVLLLFDGLELRAPTDGVRGALLRYVPWLRPPMYPRAALDNVSGSFRPRTLSLVLGPPLSGKSALLKALAGRLSGVGVTSQFRGSVSYAGRPLYPPHRHKKGEVVVDKLVSYVPQNVALIQTLSARQILQFAHNLFGQPTAKQLMAEGLLAEESEQLRAMHSSYPEMLLKGSGLEAVADVPVVALTDGQRRLLSWAEGTVLQAPVLLLDNGLTGIDSNIAYQLCVGLRFSARERHRTYVIAQASIAPELFDVFDDLTLMSGGRVVYQGPRSQVVEYFQSLGFQCPAGMHAADFVQDLLQPAGLAKYRAAHAPNPNPDLAQLWQSSALCHERAAEDIELSKESAGELAQLPTVGFHNRKFTHRYTGGVWRGTVLCIKRQWFLTYGNKAGLVIRLFISMFVSFVIGSLFFDLHLTDYNAKTGVVFYAMMSNSMAFSAVPAIVNGRHILYREMAANFYPPVSWVTACQLADIPIAAAEALLFCTIVYWMCAFSPVVSDFFVFTSGVFLVKVGMVSFRLFGLLSPNDVLGTGAAAIIVLLLLIHTGYAIALVNVKPWWLWMYWVSPVQYGLTAMTLTEFHSDHYSDLKDPTNPSLGTWGNYYLALRRLSTDQDRLWTCFMFLLGFPVVIFVLTCLALAYIRWPDPAPTPPPPACSVPAEEVQPDLPGDEEQPGLEAPLPIAPCTLAWRRVTYRPAVPGKKGKAGPQLLSDISGCACAGNLTLIVGKNGSGKTLLLEVIGGRRTLGSVEGAVLLNGRPVEAAVRRRVVGLASRATCHSLQTTVEEAMQWSAALCLPRSIPKAAKQAHIQRLVALFGLADIAAYQIGELTPQSLAVATVAVELAANPSVLLLDDLTTGLDWAAMQRLLPALRTLRQDGRALVLAAHQPSLDLLALVDTLVVLRGGRVMCAGDATFGCAELIDFLHSIPEVPRYRVEQNAVHWILSLARDRETDVVEQYERSALWATNARRLEAAATPDPVAADPVAAAGPHAYQTSRPMQFALLLQKWGRIHWRCHVYNWSRVATSVMLGLVLGSAFWQIQVTDQQSAFSLVSMQYLSMVFMGFLFMNTVQGVVSRERSVYYCDKARHMYSPWILNGVMALWESLLICFNSLVAVAIFYPMVHLSTEFGVIVFWYWNFVLYILFSTLFGLLCGLLMPVQELVLVLMGVLTTLFALMTGYLLPRPQIPWWWRWLHYGSPLPYSFQIATGVQLYCEAADVDASHPGNCTTFPSVVNGTAVDSPLWPAVRDRFSISYGDRWMYLGIVCSMIIIVHLLTGLVLAKVDHGKR